MPDVDINSLVVGINAGNAGGGIITLDLPRAVVDAKSGNNNNDDDEFFCIGRR